ncbi:hypothetical protein Ate01nite_45680 [Actinoplanes teichomyceticus]|nr:hypothetical protein Ate01nite_45680 [Actinoplanes teichomyceticus]
MRPGQHLLNYVLSEIPVAGEDDRVAQQAGQAGHRELLEGHTPIDVPRAPPVHRHPDIFPECPAPDRPMTITGDGRLVEPPLRPARAGLGVAVLDG